MRSLDRLIDQVRKQTENEEFSQFTGIGDQEFIQYLNDAQYNLQSLIVQQHPRVFIDEVVVDSVVGKERYDLPSNAFLGNMVHNVEYSSTGVEADFYTLEQDTLKYRSSGITGDPIKYIRISNQILLTPTPQTQGKIRINYVKRLRELDKRQAQIVKSANQTISSANFTLSLETNDFDTNIEFLKEHDFICIVDKEGRNIVKNIEITGVSLSELTCVGHTLADGESATVPAGSYIVGGKDTTTHSELSIETERYLIAYAAWKILKRDSSVDSQEAEGELSRMAEEIVKSYAVITDDIQYIPQLTNWSDWS